MAKHLLQSLLEVSEKSARIARAWRCQEELFELVVEEKTEKEKNERFVRDFKTLADVLVQEVVKHDVALQYPELQGFILGEESNLFTNNLGSEIVIEVKQSAEDTAKLIATVLEGKESAAHLLADLIHDKTFLEEDELQLLEKDLDFDLPLTNLGIWVDPIDSTLEYMSTSTGEKVEDIVVSGLPCATVLIGVFDRDTGRPVAGVINQPFSVLTEDNDKSKCWTGRRIWGISYGDHQCYYLGKKEGKSTKVSQKDENYNFNYSVAISKSESEDIREMLLSSGARIYIIAGVGHKLLNVIDGNVDFYILSHASSFRWDTCAPHAILSSMGGGVLCYQQAVALKSMLKELDQTKLKQRELKYHRPNLETGKRWAHTGGLIAFKSYQEVARLLKCLS